MKMTLHALVPLRLLCMPTLNPHHTTQHHLTFLQLLIARHDACNVTLVSRRRALPRQRMPLCRLSRIEKAPDSRERCVGLQSNRTPFCSEPKSWNRQSGEVTVLQRVNVRQRREGLVTSDIFVAKSGYKSRYRKNSKMSDFCTKLEEPYEPRLSWAEPPTSPCLFSLSPGLKPPCVPANNCSLKSPDSKCFYHVKRSDFFAYYPDGVDGGGEKVWNGFPRGDTKLVLKGGKCIINKSFEENGMNISIPILGNIGMEKPVFLSTLNKHI